MQTVHCGQQGNPRAANGLGGHVEELRGSSESRHEKRPLRHRTGSASCAAPPEAIRARTSSDEARGETLGREIRRGLAECGGPICCRLEPSQDSLPHIWLRFLPRRWPQRRSNPDCCKHQRKRSLLLRRSLASPRLPDRLPSDRATRPRASDSLTDRAAAASAPLLPDIAATRRLERRGPAKGKEDITGKARAGTGGMADAERKGRRQAMLHWDAEDQSGAGLPERRADHIFSAPFPVPRQQPAAI